MNICSQDRNRTCNFRRYLLALPTASTIPPPDYFACLSKLSTYILGSGTFTRPLVLLAMVVKVGLEPNTVQRRSRQPYLLRVGDLGTIPHYVHLTIYPTSSG